MGAQRAKLWEWFSSRAIKWKMRTNAAMPTWEGRELSCRIGSVKSVHLLGTKNEDRCSDAYIGRQRAKLQEWFG